MKNFISILFFVLTLSQTIISQWYQQTSGTTEGLYGVSFTCANIGTVVGYNGTILRTTNAGTTWTPQSSGTTVILFDVCFTDGKIGTAVGENGTVLRTSNGGAIWLPRTSGTTQDLYSVSFSDEYFGTVVGQGGTILRTWNRGTNWTYQTSGIFNQLFDVYFTDANWGTAVGKDGVILRTTNGGVSFVEEEEIGGLPNDYSLSQNYPNPFNPSTVIKYSVPNVSWVTIKVYDIIGNEIETLADEEKSSGIYQLTWYAENLPAGVYFYRLQAGDFLETKKMVLLK